MNQSFFSLDEKILRLSQKALSQCAESFRRVEEISEYNTQKVLHAFQTHRISESHLAGSTGYGYGDRGRDALDAVFAQIMGCEDALVRHSFVSGTSTITHALFAVLRPNDTIVSLTGLPYDTLHSVLGLGTNGIGSLKDFGIHYEQLELLNNGQVDYDSIPHAVKNVKVAYIQRSRGYSLRPSLSIAQISKIIDLVRQSNPNAIIMVDNCYGEFVEYQEPGDMGADLIMGSLIKNPGGGIARTGGYIAGKKEYVELCAHRITSPGVGREVGASLEETAPMFMGLFYAPEVVCAAVKTAIFGAALLSELGFEVTPDPQELRSDIIQTVILNSPQALTAFCQGIQRGAPIDSFVSPEAWDMPGYDDPVIMAAGAFHNGASIELSADGPMRSPYAAWMQGGLTWPSGKLGVMLAAQSLLDNGLVEI